LNSSSQSATVNEATPSTKIPVISQSSVVAQESNMQPVQFQSSPDYKRWQTQSPNLPQPAIYPAVNPLYGQEPKKVEMKIDPPPPSGRHFKKQLDHTKPQVVCVSADKCKGPNQKVYEKVCINYSKEGLRRIPAKQEQQREGKTNLKLAKILVKILANLLLTAGMLNLSAITGYMNCGILLASRRAAKITFSNSTFIFLRKIRRENYVKKREKLLLTECLHVCLS